MNFPIDNVHELLRACIIAAGLAQVTIAAASLAIPKLLGWKGELAQVSPLTQQVFWVYAAYILISNLAFGILSIVDSDALLDKSVLAISVTGFIALWWIVRLVIQFTYFDKSQMPGGTVNRFLGGALTCAFTFLGATYTIAFFINLRG